jgi:hypothetical protein
MNFRLGKSVLAADGYHGELQRHAERDNSRRKWRKIKASSTSTLNTVTEISFRLVI